MASSLSKLPNSIANAAGGTLDYGVYLSYKAGKTRYNLVDHIQYRLATAKISIFIDHLLERESSVRYEMFKAIPRSRLCLVVLSPDYVSSKWCLDELSRIMECKHETGSIVVPVFDGVDPSGADFGEALASHGQDVPVERMMKWQEALKEAANLPGWDVRGRDEAAAAQLIVRDISDKLISVESFGNVFGLAPKIKEVQQLLDLRSDDVRKIGIWGMGGAGKTTLAKVIFKSICNEFEACCFIENVRETIIKHGLQSLERNLFSELVLRDRERNAWSEQQSSYLTKDMLRQKKTLLVLDDINSREPLELFSGPGWFGPGSRIIITTRDRQLLHGADALCDVTPLEADAALQLFSWYAFRRNQPPDDHVQVSENFVSYAKGNPLALALLGSHLSNQSPIEWHNALENLQRFTNMQILEVLEQSLKGLRTNEKEAFLDIACFLDGEELDIVRNILVARGLHPDWIVPVLKDKALVRITDAKLFMHDLVSEMGKNIVRKESAQPDRRSRLWLAEDISHVLMKQKVSQKVEAICFDLSHIRTMVLPSGAFQWIPKLKLLRFFDSQSTGHSYNLQLPQGLHYLPEELRFLHWDAFPLETLPLAFSPTNLMELHMPFSKLKELWTAKQCVPNLRLIDLSHSNLTRTPELLQADALETIKLNDCKNLVDVSSIRYFTNLQRLDLRGCTNLRKLPRMEHCGKLTNLNLSNCSSLRELPELPGNIKYLYLARLPIKELHPSIEHLCNLVELDVGQCVKLRHFPTSICKFTSLKKLVVSGCPEINRHDLLTELQDENILQESDFKLSKHGSLEDLRIILLALLNMENMEWFLLYTSIIMEGTSAVFEQLQYCLLGLVMAALGLLLCLVELACKLKKEHATFEYKGCLPWFYSTYPTHKLFGSTIEYFGLGAAIWQVFHSTIGYLYARRNERHPIQMTIVMFMFCLSQLIAKLIKKYSKPDPELQVIIVQL